MSCWSNPPYQYRVRQIVLTVILILSAGGAFSITEAESNPRLKTERDLALAALNDGNRLATTWTRDSLHEAINRYKLAASIGRVANFHVAFEALRKAAAVHFTLGEYSASLKLSLEASTLSNRHGRRLEVMEAFTDVGKAYSALGQKEKALEYLQKVLVFAEGNGRAATSTQKQQLAAQARIYLGEIYYTQGGASRALNSFKRAEKLLSELGDRRGEAEAKLNVGYAASALADQQEALSRFNNAIDLFRTAADPRGEAQVLTAIGSIRSLQGNEDAAIDLHRKAMSMFREIGDVQGEGVTLNGLGQAYDDLGDRLTALDFYSQALTCFEKTGSIELATVSKYKIGKVHKALGHLDEALKHYQQSIQLSQSAGRRRMEAYALKDMAEIYSIQQKNTQTFEQYQKILNLYRTLRDFRGQAITLSSIGDLYFAAGDKRNAMEQYRRALPLIRTTLDREGEISILFALGRTALELKQLDEARSRVEQSIKIIETLRTYVNNADLRTTYFAAVNQNYDLYVQILMQLEREHPGKGYAELALQASESGRARALVEVLAEARANLPAIVKPELEKREQELYETINDKERLALELSSAPELRVEAGALAREIRQLRTELQAVQARIRIESPRYAALTQPQPLSVKQIQEELRGEDTLVLEYTLGEEKSYLWAISQDSFNSFELPARAIVESAAREVYDLITTRQRVRDDPNYANLVAQADALYDEKATTLVQILLGPLATSLGNKRLLIVPHGVLQYIPFEALPVPQAETNQIANEQTWLGANHEVISLPSVSVLAAMRRELKSSDYPVQKVISVFADPVFEADDRRVQRSNAGELQNAENQTERLALRDFNPFGKEKTIPRLGFTRTESQVIMNLAPAGSADSSLDFEADRNAVLNAKLDQYQIIHFATHSLINSNQPQWSGILLSRVNRNGASQNGFLQLSDIYHLKLSAKLVVLSSCNSGLGNEVKGEGLIGLTRGFMYAGSKSVVASLWKVDDRATSELMSRFYRAMLQDNLSPAAALRVAKESLRRESRWRAPYYWAAFVIQGEYREHIVVQRANSRVNYIMLGSSLMLICLISALYVRHRLRKRTASPRSYSAG